MLLRLKTHVIAFKNTFQCVKKKRQSVNGSVNA